MSSGLGCVCLVLLLFLFFVFGGFFWGGVGSFSLYPRTCKNENQQITSLKEWFCLHQIWLKRLHQQYTKCKQIHLSMRLISCCKQLGIVFKNTVKITSPIMNKLKCGTFALCQYLIVPGDQQKDLTELDLKATIMSVDNSQVIRPVGPISLTTYK